MVKGVLSNLTSDNVRYVEVIVSIQEWLAKGLSLNDLVATLNSEAKEVESKGSIECYWIIVFCLSVCLIIFLPFFLRYVVNTAIKSSIFGGSGGYSRFNSFVRTYTHAARFDSCSEFALCHRHQLFSLFTMLICIRARHGFFESNKSRSSCDSSRRWIASFSGRCSWGGRYNSHGTNRPWNSISGRSRNLKVIEGNRFADISTLVLKQWRV